MKIDLDPTSLLRSRKAQYAIAAIAIAAILPIFVRSEYVIGHVFAVIIIFAIYASSWNLLAYSGQGSLGHAAFLGIGGFASALLATRLSVPPIIGLVIGSFFSAGIGFLIGLACVRLKAWFLAMVTFGFSVIAVTIISQLDPYIGGMIGFGPVPAIAPLTLPFYYATLATAALSIIIIYIVMKSKFGLAFKAIRENELEAKMVGVNAAKYKLIAFVVSTFFAGLAGGLYAQSQQFIQIKFFEPYYSFLPLIMAVIGGLGTIEGPLIGSVIIVAIDSYLPPLTDRLLAPLSPFLPGVSSIGSPLGRAGLGLFLIVVIIFLPKGLTSLFSKAYTYLKPQLTKIYDYFTKETPKARVNGKT